MTETERGRRNHLRKEARRRVLPGHPVEARPFTAAEVDAYLSGDLIACLLCGQRMAKLGQHLRTIHGVEVDDYKAAYGLPWRIGLAGKATRERYSAVSRRNLERHDHLAQYRHLARDDHPRRARQPYHAERSTAVLMRDSGRSGGHPDGTFDEYLRRMAAGRTRAEVSSDPDMPNPEWLTTMMRGDPALRARYDATIAALPFAVQARTEGLGERFVAEVRRLRHADGGRRPTDRTIAEALGVTAMTVHRARRLNGIP